MRAAAAAWAAAPASITSWTRSRSATAADYAVFDTAKNRVLMARTNYTTAIDAKTGTVSEVKSASAGHMALTIPGTSLLVLPRGRGSVAIVDGATDQQLADLPAGMNPDGAAYDPFSKMVFVMNHGSGEATVVDPMAKKVVASIRSAACSNFVPTARKVFVNVEDKNEIGVIDVKQQKTIARYPLNGCEAPTGLAYVPGPKLLVASCGQSGTAKFIRADTGAEAASLKIPVGADAVMYDAKRNVVLIPTRSGFLEVISVADPAHISVVQEVPTAVGSRTGTVDPNTGRVYMMSAKFGPPAQPGGRAQALPGTFEVIVVAP